MKLLLIMTTCEFGNSGNNNVMLAAFFTNQKETGSEEKQR